ncbi:MAG TPA: proline dehydrogenase family protein [Candidatus Limnocylindria bacterium]|nr:proline dehydrogenase family protein [Candidatus Limnocylindria bacterium]
MRSILLWCARNSWLRRTIPRLPFAQRAVRRFMPGEDMEDALRAAGDLQARGIPSIFTHLGENLAELSQAKEVAAHYRELIDRFARWGLRPDVSPKLTQLGLDHDPDTTFRLASGLARQTHAAGGRFWMDMEDSSYVDATLDLYQRLLAVQPGIGVCLQAYLHRTPADVERLLPLGAGVRLVKGAYNEPSDRALRDKSDVNVAFRDLALRMLPAAAAGRLRLGLGTHDVELVKTIAATAAEAGIRKEAFEVQMLYGIRVDQQHRLRAEGYRVRVLIAYGDYWYPWYVRRLAERPANLWFALRQLLPW